MIVGTRGHNRRAKVAPGVPAHLMPTLHQQPGKRQTRVDMAEGGNGANRKRYMV
ncbi:MAG: hypothetical protein R3E79_23065 [Caldilineaceae bacterium]